MKLKSILLLISILALQFIQTSEASAKPIKSSTFKVDKKTQLFIKAFDRKSKNLVSVYPEAGFNNTDCRKGILKDCPAAVGWPGDQSLLGTTGNAKVVRGVNPYTGKEEDTIYYEVFFSYDATSENYKGLKEGTGYISEKFLDKDRNSKFFEKVNQIRKNEQLKIEQATKEKQTEKEKKAEKLKQIQIEKEKEEEKAEKKKLAEEARKKLAAEIKESEKKSNLMIQKAEAEKAKKEKLALVQKDTQKEICDPPEKTSVMQKAKNLTDLSQLTKHLSNDYDEKVEKIYELVGECMIDPTKSKKFSNSDLLFDQLVLPKVNKKPNMTVRRQKESTKDQFNIIPEYETVKVTYKDMIDIEAMARTLVGEMGVCFDDGIQYPMSVAKIIKNRSEKSFFAVENKKQSPEKGMISKVATHGAQFNNWKPGNNKKFGARHSFYQSLCPAKEVGQKFGVNQVADARTVQDWETAVSIATEAVLYPVEFDKKTKDLENVHHYTSNQERDTKYYKKIDGKTINNRKISSDACVMLWRDKTNGT